MQDLKSGKMSVGRSQRKMNHRRRYNIGRKGNHPWVRNKGRKFNNRQKKAATSLQNAVDAKLPETIEKGFTTARPPA